MHSPVCAFSTTISSQQSSTYATQSEPVRYVCVPHKLLTAAAYDPLAIGIYSLIARLYLIVQAPLPLSTADVRRYDPSLSRGAIIRALDRLTHGGWLVISEQAGHKTCYVPTWGRVESAPRIWRMDLPHLGRPRHIQTLRLDLRLLDTYLGKLTPQPTRPALVTRYVTQPLLGLRDVGAYALTLADIPTETPLLKEWGLIHHRQAQLVPSDQAILALVTQQALEDDQAIKLTSKGMQKLGLGVFTPPEEAQAQGQVLAFVSPAMIDQVIGKGITEVIVSEDRDTAQSSAYRCTKTGVSDANSDIPWESLRTHEDHGTPPPTPPQRRVRGGGMYPGADSVPGRAKLPDTEVAQLLHTLNVRPRQVAELADVPLDLVRAAIADGQARPYVRDLAGWVVAMVRDARDQGWRIAPPAVPPSDAHAAALRASFTQLYGEGLTDASDDERAGDDERASDDDPRVAAGLTVGAHADTPPLGAMGDTPSASVPTLPDADAEPHETLTAQLQRELRVRTYPDLHPLIARLTLQQAGDTLIIGCARASDLPLVQARLLPLLGPILRQFGWSHRCELVIGMAKTSDFMRGQTSAVARGCTGMV